MNTYTHLYNQVIWIKSYCPRCGCEVITLGNRAEKFCRCCGIEHANQYRHYPSIVRSEFKAQAVGHD